MTNKQKKSIKETVVTLKKLDWNSLQIINSVAIALKARDEMERKTKAG